MKLSFKAILPILLFVSIPRDSCPQGSVKDSLALVAIYDATDGPNWMRNDNWLTGPVETWYGVRVDRRDRIELLTLSNNNLSGQLPFIEAGLEKLERLALNNNNLSGEIPTLLNYWGLRVLHLHNNDFSGKIPPTLGYLRRLTHINLADNRLSGKLPSTFIFLRSIELLQFSGNAGLTGTLPLGLVKLGQLKTLGIADTDLCEPLDATFLSWIAGINVIGTTGCTAPVFGVEHTGTCQAALAEAELNTNNVRARILNTGGLFYRGEPHVYNVPKNTDSHAIFSAAFWIAGLKNGELRAAAARYSRWEFWAGPIDEAGRSPEPCSDYDRIYSLSLEDLELYETTGIAIADLRDWPTGLGAPTLDSEGQRLDLMSLPLSERAERVINLAAGERPQLYGTQDVWWIMNDRGNEHESTHSLPMGVEVHGQAFAVASGIAAVNNSTFYKYRVFNRNDFALEQVYIGFWVDVDLGSFDDDYIGSDPIIGLGFVYNADNADGGVSGYGTPPPALGVFFALGPRADKDGRDNDGDGAVDETEERLGMTSFITHTGDGDMWGDPQHGPDYYHHMQARWLNGEPRTLGAFGWRFSEIPERFTYSGDPVSRQFWSENNRDGLGTANSPGDRRFLVSSGPFSIGPGDDTDFTVAIIWAKGKDHLDSVTALKRSVQGVQSIFSEGFDGFSAFIPEVEHQPDPSFDLAINHNFPDPFSDETTIQYRVPQSVHVRLLVFDALGREIMTLVDAQQEAGEYSVTVHGHDLPSGVYYYRIEVDRASRTGTMVLVH